MQVILLFDRFIDCWRYINKQITDNKILIDIINTNRLFHRHQHLLDSISIISLRHIGQQPKIIVIKHKSILQELFILHKILEFLLLLSQTSLPVYKGRCGVVDTNIHVYLVIQKRLKEVQILHKIVLVGVGKRRNQFYQRKYLLHEIMELFR